MNDRPEPRRHWFRQHRWKSLVSSAFCWRVRRRLNIEKALGSKTTKVVVPRGKAGSSKASKPTGHSSTPALQDLIDRASNLSLRHTPQTQSAQRKYNPPPSSSVTALPTEVVLTSEQQAVVDLVKRGGNVFFTGPAGRFSVI